MIDPQQLFSLKGRTALVTGGSRGIGRMIAEGYVRSGARVYISARKAEACDATAKELSALGHCVSLPGDVSTLEGVHALVAAYRQHEQTLDILVNNAGAAWGAPYAEFPESGWDKVVDLNMKAPFFLTQALTRHAVEIIGGALGHHAPFVPHVLGVFEVHQLGINPSALGEFHQSVHCGAALAGRIHGLFGQ